MAAKYEGDSLLKVLKGTQGERRKQLIAQFEDMFGMKSEQLRDRKRISGIQCPNPSCHAQGQIVKYGFTDSNRSGQRYHCKACGRHFNDSTDTFFHNRKLRSHITAFLQTMLDGLTIRKTAEELNISPTTAHTWRKTVLQFIAKNWGCFLEKLEDGGVIETSVSEYKASRKGLPAERPIPADTQIVVFQCDRLHRYDVRLDSGNFAKPAKELLRNAASAHIGRTTGKHDTVCSPADRILLHSRNILRVGERFSIRYRRMRGVAQPYLLLYARWQCLLAYLDKLNRIERLRFLQTMCL